MAQTQQVGKHKTKVFTVNSETFVRYHHTDVVSFKPTNNGKRLVTLNSGGYRTLTTKTRMNQASNQFGLGFYVFQKNFEWLVEFKNGGLLSFVDEMEFKV